MRSSMDSARQNQKSLKLKWPQFMGMSVDNTPGRMTSLEHIAPPTDRTILHEEATQAKIEEFRHRLSQHSKHPFNDYRERGANQDLKQVYPRKALASFMALNKRSTSYLGHHFKAHSHFESPKSGRSRQTIEERDLYPEKFKEIRMPVDGTYKRGRKTTLQKYE